MRRKTANIFINRDRIFNPSKFIDQPGWDFWRGPANGNGLEGDLEQDYRSLDLEVVDILQIDLQNYLKPNEHRVPGEEIVRRAVEEYHIRLDLQIFQAFWDSIHLTRMLFQNKGETGTLVFFDGQVLRSPSGKRCTLGVGIKDGRPSWGLRRLARMRDSNSHSLVIPTKPKQFGNDVGEFTNTTGFIL